MPKIGFGEFVNKWHEELTIFNSCPVHVLLHEYIFLQNFLLIKRQLISKAIYGLLLTSPKKRTDEFVLFAILLFTANKQNSFIRFLGESMARQPAY